MDEKETKNVKVSDLWTEFFHNRPLRIVALKCLNLVPDLAAWMIPEGDTAFSTRNFGEGVAQQAKMTATGAIGTLTR